MDLAITCDCGNEILRSTARLRDQSIVICPCCLAPIDLAEDEIERRFQETRRVVHELRRALAALTH